jgi:hypothetical protein
VNARFPAESFGGAGAQTNTALRQIAEGGSEGLAAAQKGDKARAGLDSDLGAVAKREGIAAAQKSLGGIQKLESSADRIAHLPGVAAGDVAELKSSLKSADEATQRIIRQIPKQNLLSYAGVPELREQVSKDMATARQLLVKLDQQSRTAQAKATEATPAPAVASAAKQTPAPATQAPAQAVVAPAQSDAKPATSARTPAQDTAAFSVEVSPPADPFRCPGNNCSGIKAAGIAMNQVKAAIQSFGRAVGAQTPNKETYATFANLSDWLAADVIKRAAYCEEKGWCTVGTQDAQWAVPDRDHPELNRNSRAYAVASGILGKPASALGPDDVRAVLQSIPEATA